MKNLIILLFSIYLTGLISAQDNNLYTVSKNIIGNAEKIEDKKTVEFMVLENDKEIYKINIDLEYDIPMPALKVFEDGSSVLINTFDASLSFYETTGFQLLKLKIIKDLDVAYERTIYSSVSGKHLAISLSQPDLDYSIIQIYNNQGQVIQNWQLNKRYINGLAYSKNVDLLAISIYNWKDNILDKSTLFTKSDGIEISKILFNFTNGKFVDNENIFIGYTNEICFIYDLFENKILQKREALKNKMILQAEFIDNQILIVDVDKPYLENGIWFYRNPNVQGFRINGDLFLQMDNLGGKPFSEYQLIKNSSGLYLKTEIGEIRIK